MRSPSQVIAAVSRRTQPCEAAVPIVPPTFQTPCTAIWPGPPANSWKTYERALRASAYGPPTCPPLSRTFSSTKYLPGGVGVDAAPMTPGNARTARPWRYTVTRRSDRSTTRCQAVADRVVLAFLIQPVLPFGRPGSLTWSQRVPPLSVRWPITGSTVRPWVIGRFRSTQTRRAERLSGLVIAVCPWTNTASSWVRATVGVAAAGAGAADQQRREERERCRRMRTGVRACAPLSPF